MIDLGFSIFIGILLGLAVSIPLIWLSWKIPQQIFAGARMYDALEWSDPAIRGFQWQDALLVLLICLCAICVIVQWGTRLNSVVAFAYCGVLILLAGIDARTRLLPDVLTLPLLWAGLLWNAAPIGDLPLEHAIWGAAVGYIALWLPCALVSSLWGREMMGYGDFKFSAAIGAWLGCFSLPFVWLIASGSSLLIALVAYRFWGRRLRNPMPFGPGLALGGILMLFFDWTTSFF